MDKEFLDNILVSLWNEYVATGGEGERVFPNEAEFFNDGRFATPYDVAWSLSIGDWRRTDEYVCFNAEGYLVSFNKWDDRNSPVDVARISTWLQTNEKNEKRYVVNNIPRAIHDALQEV